MTTDAYFDARNFAPPTGVRGGCPVSGCAARLGEVDSQWGTMPLCPAHGIRIHAKTRTFAYYNGPDPNSKRAAALRNILFERDHFKTYFLGNAAKAETHRICHENSEDALTWNVCARLARGGALSRLLSTFTTPSSENEPELYLWGLPVRFDDSSPPSLFAPLAGARSIFEADIKKFLTEPDIMLYMPGQVLVLVEAKFTSGNALAATSEVQDIAGEKPKSREGVLRRYSATALPRGSLLLPPPSGHFYSQLYRNLAFAIYMASELGVRWSLVNLVCEGQLRQREAAHAFEDPTPFIHSLLPEDSRGQFHYYSWERLYADLVANATDLRDLADYMYNKSASGVRALAV